MAMNILALSLVFLYSPIVFGLHIQQLFEFPNNTCLENLAVRPDGSIITTLTTAPELYLVQPSAENPNPQLVHTFSNYTSVLGISQETTGDSYQVATVNLTADHLNSVPGTGAVWRVRFQNESSTPIVTLTAELPEVALPNGMATLNNHTILIADSTKGEVVSVDTDTGVTKVVLTDPLMRNTKYSTNGVNGLKVRGSTLYFTSTGQKIFGKIYINPETGEARGNASVITRQFSGSDYYTYDDFALDPLGQSAFLTTAGGNSIEQVNLNTGQKVIIAGAMNSTQFAQPTSAQFARGNSRILFVATAGGYEIPVNGNIKIGGQIIAITLDK